MIDSHAHVMFDAFDADRDEVFRRAHEAGVAGWIEVGTNLEQSRKAVALAQEHENVWATVGVHPSDIESLTEESWRELGALLQQPRVVAIGEVGLDFYHTSPSLRQGYGRPARLRGAGRGGSVGQQHEALQRFVGLAQQYHLPIVFHVRSGNDIDAHEEMIKFLSSYTEHERPRGVMHTYSGTYEQAQRYLNLGMYLSFSGVVTFKSAGETAEVAKRVSLERMLIETDCPFLAPEPYRGKRNEPAYVRFVAEKIAELRGVVVNVIAEATERNTRELFSL